MEHSTAAQKAVYDSKYGLTNVSDWTVHDTTDPLRRYLRDRRIRIAIQQVQAYCKQRFSEMDALVICGGVGGEGTLLANIGFRSVTVSDLSESALDLCRRRDPRLATLLLDAEQLELPDNCFDIVLVQDGLHHLPRPVLGFTEMLRVSRKAVIVIEPHAGVVANCFGTTWERHDDTINYVFRWNRHVLGEVTRSYILQMPCHVHCIRIWDHNSVMYKVARLFGRKALALQLVKLAYGSLNAMLWWMGNMMVGIVVKHPNE